MNILVTGGNGFLGVNLCMALLEAGHTVISIDNFYSSSKDNQIIFEKNTNYKFLEHDIRYPLSDILEKNNIKDIDQIYHLACPASPPKYQYNKIYTHETALYGVINVLQYALHNDCSVLFTSTSEVYGDPQVDLQSESYRGNVNTMGIRACYDEGKRMGETLCHDYHITHNIDVKIARIFNTYGPHMDPDDGRIVSNFIKQCLNNEDITIYGTGEQTRSLCYVDDTIRGLMLLMESESSCDPINIGNPNELSVNEIANIIKELIQSDNNLINLPLPQDDPRKRFPAIAKAKRVLEWTPTTDIKDGLLNTITYFKEKLKDKNE